MKTFPDLQPLVKNSYAFKQSSGVHPVVNDLVRLISENNWTDRFEQAIRHAQQFRIPQLNHLQSLEDYLVWMNDWLYWVPSESFEGKEMYNQICIFYFILNQPSVYELQSKIHPHTQNEPLTPLSQWMVSYAAAMGQFLDTPESLTEERLQTFYDSPAYRMHEYIRPHGGWKTFNQFFARHYKPGYRPVAAIEDHTVIVSPADCTFGGQWQVCKDSKVTIKSLEWTIAQLLEGSPYKDRFANGIFTHSFLNTTDYHRLHTPVAGKVLEARVIQGQVYMDVVALPVEEQEAGAHKIAKVHKFDIPDSPGYQFVQTRGLFIIESPVGLVAVLPIGMAQVSSVIATAEEGVMLRKGEEIGYFQFGGSDVVVLYEAGCKVKMTAQEGVHYRQGTKIAEAGE